uniref:Uncharacterized protein n=1 Tax=Megaselia scalaris TaxID=36166 RepID=T1GQU0_MEGSC
MSNSSTSKDESFCDGNFAGLSDHQIYGRGLEWAKLIEKLSMRTKNESIENSIGLDEFEVLFKDQDQDNETDDDEAVEDNSDILKIIEQEEHNEDFNKL